MSKEKFSYPIDHFSYSSMMKFLSNRYMFKKQYILKIYDFKWSLAALVGRACHKALQEYYTNYNADKASQTGIEVIERTKDDQIEWGKTGTREKLLEKYNKALGFYFAEMPEYHEVLGVEKSLTSFIKNEAGVEFALPAKSISDLIVCNKDETIDIVDHKFISSYTESESEKGSLMMQAMFNYHNIKNEYNVIPKRMIYNECKVSKNTDGSAQLQPYIIEFKKHPEYFELFYNLYNECTREISKPDCLYLPNFNDRFEAEQTFIDYKAHTIDVESPIKVEHKTGDFEFVEKKFVSAPVDLVDNRDMIPEEKIRTKLLEFGIPVKMMDTNNNSSVIQYTLKPSRGVSMSKVEKYINDIQFALKAGSIRVQAPIPGTDLVGIEIPNFERKTIEMEDKHIEIDTLNIPIGIDVYGNIIKKDITEMPHLLVAGSTGSGKSVFINVIIQALMKQQSPSELQFVLIDPKRVELSQYKGNEYVMSNPIYEIPEAIKALSWLIDEMESRYNTLENHGVKNIQEYKNEIGKPMPYIIAVIDEYADLTLQDERTEKIIVRLAQKARAVGIHLVIGTQRPSVDVISGIIKANFPTRIAFMTSSRTDSQVILDQTGAEQLIGKGDALFLNPHERGLTRLQSLFVK